MGAGGQWALGDIAVNGLYVNASGDTDDSVAQMAYNTWQALEEGLNVEATIVGGSAVSIEGVVTVDGSVSVNNFADLTNFVLKVEYPQDDDGTNDIPPPIGAPYTNVPPVGGTNFDFELPTNQWTEAGEAQTDLALRGHMFKGAMSNWFTRLANFPVPSFGSNKVFVIDVSLTNFFSWAADQVDEDEVPIFDAWVCDPPPWSLWQISFDAESSEVFAMIRKVILWAAYLSFFAILLPKIIKVAIS